LEAQAEVAGYGNAVFADHGDAGTAIWGEWMLVGGLEGEEGWRSLLMEKGELWRVG